MKRTYPAPGRRLERGQFSWVTLALLLGLSGAIYLAVVWVPIYVLHYEVKQTVRDYMNQAVKNRNDVWLVETMCLRLASLDSTEEVGRDGRKTRVPTVQVEPREVTWDRDESSRPPMLHVAFEYVRVVRYPYLDREEEKVMAVDFTEDISVPVWGNPR